LLSRLRRLNNKVKITHDPPRAHDIDGDVESKEDDSELEVKIGDSHHASITFVCNEQEQLIHIEIPSGLLSTKSTLQSMIDKAARDEIPASNNSEEDEQNDSAKEAWKVAMKAADTALKEKEKERKKAAEIAVQMKKVQIASGLSKEEARDYAARDVDIKSGKARGKHAMK